MKQRNFTHQLTACALAIVTLIIAQPSQASIVGALTLDDLLRGSTLIVQGEVS